MALPASQLATKTQSRPALQQKPAPNREPVSIAGSDRVFFCGKTGSGKSYGAMQLLAAQARLVCIDLKRSDTIGVMPFDEPGTQTLRDLENGRPVRVRVSDREQAIYYMGAAYAAGGCIVYIDEVLALVPQSSKPPQELEAIWTRGRELGVGGWAATQRPVWVPLWLMSEAEWTFMFRLRMPEDRRRMAAFISEEVESPIPDEHGFFVWRDHWDEPQYYRAISSGVKLESRRAPK